MILKLGFQFVFALTGETADGIADTFFLRRNGKEEIAEGRLQNKGQGDDGSDSKL